MAERVSLVPWVPTNGMLETLQDGSHLYSTEHSTAPTVKAMINLEGILIPFVRASSTMADLLLAAGSTGGALLFQATSKEMIEAYVHAPL